MTKIELEEILKIIDAGIETMKRCRSETSSVIDSHYFSGRKHALEDIKIAIKYQYRNILEAAE